MLIVDDYTGIDAPTLSSLLIHSRTITSVVTPDSTIKILESTAAAIRCAGILC